MRISSLATIAVLPVLLALAGCEAISTEMAINHYVAGKLALERQAYQEALAELAQAIEYDPDLSLAHTVIGDIHRKRGNYPLAAAAYEQACRINPYAFRPHYNLGVTYQMLAESAATAQAVSDSFHKAVQVYLRAVTLRPEDFDTNMNLSACYFQRGKYDLAEQYSKACVNISPGNSFARSNLGIIYDAQNLPHDAIRAYKSSLELDTHQPKVLLNLGSTYMRLRRMNEALNAFEMVARQTPTSPSPWVEMGACHYHLKDWPSALAAYEKAVAIDGNSAEGHRGVGVVYMTQFVGDQNNTALQGKALAAWHRSLDIDSNQPDLLRLVRKYTPGFTGPEL
ncbi:hypothetical protein LCGC14_1875600 [marine sediment metagenome]|uniref:Uncharacterized protein n=1 Tax=marine sediment metagenome TaxID=412755 RepID=A0A0F9GRV4_9ZZZZ